MDILRKSLSTFIKETKGLKGPQIAEKLHESIKPDIGSIWISKKYETRKRGYFHITVIESVSSDMMVHYGRLEVKDSIYTADLEDIKFDMHTTDIITFIGAKTRIDV